MLGDSVEVTDGYRSWWSYVPHFIATPGYVYAYAYGQLLALSVYGRYEERGRRRSCRATSSCCAPAARARRRSWAQIVGVDLADPGFWDAGLDLVERQLQEAEAAAPQQRSALAPNSLSGWRWVSSLSGWRWVSSLSGWRCGQ